MDIENLIRMGNQIAGFYESYPDQVEARKEIANHLKKFWAPRMRTKLLDHVERSEGQGLSDELLASVREYRTMLMPG
jgi:formate dehydrogenase subunit delta